MGPHSGLNIGFGQAGIGIKQICFGRTFPELSEDQFYGNACAMDDGFAHHYFGIHLNARCRHGVSVGVWDEYSRLTGQYPEKRGESRNGTAVRRELSICTTRIC